jgi:tRNA G18 (ribose-2'-O)-methylase SpoU
MQQLRGTELRRFKRKQPKTGPEIVLVLDQLQYARNVAELFRIADAVKIAKLFLCGSTPVPPFGKELQKVSRSKEKSVQWQHHATALKAISVLRREGFKIVALELADKAENISSFATKNREQKLALVLGNEVSGVGKATLQAADGAVYVPMLGKGASLNVAVSAAVAVYTLLL